MRFLKLWIALAVVTAASFAVLGYYGYQIYRQAPPIPARVVDTEGRVMFTAENIRDGQNAWQSMGGQEVGSVWGHGAYVAPDWTADYLHRQSLWLLDRWSLEAHGARFDDLGSAEQAVLKDRLKRESRTNTYDAAADEILISTDRAAAYDALAGYYAALFGDATEFPEEIRDYSDAGMTPPELRDAYAIPRNALSDPQRQADMAAFFFWATWAASTERPDTGGGAEAAGRTTPAVTYTNNWPAEELIDNKPSAAVVIWSVISVVVLLAGIAALAWYHATLKGKESVDHDLPTSDPLLALTPTPSMKATLKYFWVVMALILVQITMGAVTAHYGVEGGGFYGFELSEWLPYAVTRTWHTQLAIFWIATAWLATGLFMAPAVSGYEPKYQRLGVNFLWVCLLLIVVGSCFGTWYATRQRMGYEMNFWFGHQGYEYVDLGRFWQIFLLVGLVLWLGLMTRALWPALRKPTANRHLLVLFLIASAAIALFWAAGLMWGRQTHLAIAEYWRWWVVHLWVEGFFEVFATVVIAFLFTRMGLLRIITATAAVLLSTTIFLGGGILGTFHHLYFSGTPTAILALGATFSALEVVPLVLIGFEAYENLSLSRVKPWVAAYRWPIYFFIAVGFWNLVGAGLFGFLINPPIALYYMQGLNTTAVHGHTALFGVYGMLGIGLMLFCLKGLNPQKEWKTKSLSAAFWSINAGLVLMVVMSLLPVGLLQTWASVEHGMWYARSAEYLQSDLMNILRWLRIVGDTIFGIGLVVLAWFIAGLKTGWSLESNTPAATSPATTGTPQHT